MMSMLNSNDYIEHIRRARGKKSVLLVRYMSLRASYPKSLVIAFEGEDDKIVYGCWINRVRPDLWYETIVCNGKQGVAHLKEIIDTNIVTCQGVTYFVVDRDFDDYQPFLDTNRVFMTDRFSVENYLVSTEVAEKVLRDLLPIDCLADVREACLALFESLYDDFLTITREHNLRLYIAVSKKIRLSRPIPDKISTLAVVTATSVSPSNTSIDDIIFFQDDGNDDYTSILTEQFCQLNRRDRYRGKNSILFFKAWLFAIARSCDAHEGVFGLLHGDARARQSEIGLSSFAARSSLPVGFEAFVLGLG